MFLKQVKQVFSWLTLGVFSSTISLSLSPPARAQTYSDIQGHWAENCIQQLTQQGIISGYPNGTFRPDDIINRAEFAAIVNQAFPKVPTEREAIDFQDVSSNYWGQEAIRTAYRKGFLSGYPEQRFQPNQFIKRVQTFVSLASGLNYSSPASPNQILNATYTDAAEIPDYARDDIAAATQQGIVISLPKPQFDQRLLGPSDPTTRAQVAAALCQVKNLAGVPNEYIVNFSQPGNQPNKGDSISLGQRCTNDQIGYAVSYPNNWQTNSGEVVNQCEVFDSESIQLEPYTEDFDEAVYFDLEKVSFDRLANPDSRSANVISRREITIDGRQAVVIETEATGFGLLPEGRLSYKYVIDFGDRTLVATTYDVPNQDYQRNKQVLDRMVDSLDLIQ
ncbi:MAG: S-layer homology domain-containing protein [Scytonema sp. PMC 1069.18]|nr:S-layer homology domain-containing protein [Scytonema sp. PMC 1069.18]MEC4880299.1 S-layer homology domain-containing protein [Scytonema sp. PMC 1070.18]